METKRSYPWLVLVVLALVLGLSFQTACAQAKKETKKTTGDMDIWVEDLIPIPAPKQEVITEEPGEDYVWIPGYWERYPDEWEWIAGHWEKPPHKKAHWVNGSWRWEEGKWHWNPGHWMVSYLGTGLFVNEPLSSPPLLEETRPPKPSDYNHWVPGYWEWDGTWFWMPGYWTARTDVDAKWVPAGWTEAGEFGYKWTAGHWGLK
jgi:hypothetical protein